MKIIASAAARCVAFGASCALLAACAAGSKSAPSAAPDSGRVGGYPQQQPGYPTGTSAQSTTTPATPPAPPPPPPSQPYAQPPGQDSPQSRAAAAQSAANEIESSSRELDVAAGDCRNACRALGSMDRAAGRLCGLTQGDNEMRRCDDAKRRVYSARDRVKATCGQCEGGPSVERSAPIPSLR